MFTCVCVFRKEDERLELTVGVKYEVIQAREDEVFVVNDVNGVKWYPSYYFKIV